jgi:hypothetical protein
LLKYFNTNVNFSISPRFFMDINHLQQLEFCWKFFVEFVLIFTKTCWENFNLDKITKKLTGTTCVVPLLLLMLLWLPLLPRYECLLPWLLRLPVFFGHHVYYCYQQYSVPVDTVATMITKVTHVCWLLWLCEHTRSDLCCGHFLFSINQLKRSCCVILPAYITLCEFNFI